MVHLERDTCMVSISDDRRQIFCKLQVDEKNSSSKFRSFDKLLFMKSSPAELSYIKDSLAYENPIRPDARNANQFRPIEASTGFLPLTNGSSRVVASDGAECVVGVKARVIRKSRLEDPILDETPPRLVQVSVDITGLRDDDFLICQMVDLLESTLNSGKLQQTLSISSTYTFQLFIDALVLSHTSHPIGMLSFAVYLALKSSRLPKLESEADDSKAEEVPQFNDDWDSSVPLFGPTWSPPLIIYIAAIGENVIVDPSEIEEQVAAVGILVGWADGSIKAPLSTIALSPASADTISSKILQRAISLANTCGGDLSKSLDSVIKLDLQDGPVY